LAFREVYRKQVELLIKILPFIAEEDCFALKGWTAINLFVRDMPRLSVDIDLTYLPVLSRSESLDAIDAAMKRIAGRIPKILHLAQVTPTVVQPGNRRAGRAWPRRHYSGQALRLPLPARVYLPREAAEGAEIRLPPVARLAANQKSSNGSARCGLRPMSPFADIAKCRHSPTFPLVAVR